MSTAKKRTIKYSAFVATLILIVAYFSLLSPTSAYFYKTETSETTIQFATFDVEQTLFENKDVLKFKGATKLCDTNELLFDEVAIVKEITLVNKGQSPARILVDVTPLEDSFENGLRYVAFIEKVDGTETVEDEATSGAVTKGPIKQKLETLFGINEDSNLTDVDNLINTHNESLRNTNGNDDKILLASGESAKVRIVFWVEYDAAQNAAGGKAKWQNAGEIVNIEYPCNVRIIAVQDNDEAVEDALTEATTVEETEATTVEETEATTIEEQTEEQ